MIRLTFILLCLLVFTFAVQPVLAQWSLVDAGITATINNVSYPQNNDVWACDADGNVWASADAGQSWSTQASFDFQNLYGIAFADNQFGTAVALSGNIYSTSNGGANWTTVQEGWILTFYDVCTIPGTNSAWVAGQNSIFMPFVQWTHDGWTTDDAAGFYIDVDGISTEGMIRGIAAHNANDLVAGCRTWSGEGAICISSDGGSSWSTVWNGFYPVMDVAAGEGGVTIAVLNDGSIMISTDYGATWPDTNPGIGAGLFGIDFAGDNTFWAVGAEGTIVETTNNGAGWGTPVPITNETLRSVSFSSPSNGVAVGDNGTVLVYGGANEPAVLDLIPVQTEIPAQGGTVVYDASFVSTVPNTINGLRYWTMVLAPNGQIFGPTYSQNFVHTPNMSVYVSGLTQTVPDYAPGGEYTFTGYIGFYPNGLINDSFTFFKEGGGHADGYGFTPDDWVTNGRFVTYDDPEIIELQPTGFSLSEAFPNPFNSSTTFSLHLPESARLTVRVYDVTGRIVTTLAQGEFSTGSHALVFNASELASGIYFVQLDVAGQANLRQKVVLMK